jgi:hypothetical protein
MRVGLVFLDQRLGIVRPEGRPQPSLRQAVAEFPPAIGLSHLLFPVLTRRAIGGLATALRAVDSEVLIRKHKHLRMRVVLVFLDQRLAMVRPKAGPSPSLRQALAASIRKQDRRGKSPPILPFSC